MKQVNSTDLMIIIPCVTKAAVFNYYSWDHRESHTVLATGCVACNKRFACGLFIFKGDIGLIMTECELL